MELLHGQSLAMQWVGLALQKIIADVDIGGDITKQLMGSAKSVDKGDGLDTLAIGCNYVVNFVLPFAAELALKALIIREGKEPHFSHNLSDLYNKLSESTKLQLQNKFTVHCKIDSAHTTRKLEDFFAAHKKDFVDWRYLDEAKKVKKEEKEMQLAICAILDVYNT